VSDLFSSGSLTLFRANLGQLAGIEPIAAAIGALVHLNFAFGTEKVPVQSHALTMGTIPFARHIHCDSVISREMEQGFTACFTFFIDALEFKSVEPYPTAAPLADVNYQAADLHFSQFIEASWAFHKATLAHSKPQITR